MFGFAQQELKRKSGRTYWVVVAGEGPEDGDLGTGLGARAAAVTRRHRRFLRRDGSWQEMGRRGEW